MQNEDPYRKDDYEPESTVLMVERKRLRYLERCAEILEVLDEYSMFVDAPIFGRRYWEVELMNPEKDWRTSTGRQAQRADIAEDSSITGKSKYEEPTISSAVEDALNWSPVERIPPKPKRSILRRIIVIIAVGVVAVDVIRMLIYVTGGS